ncbi:hypothetical protein LOK49_LG09G00922 [Camellia lanceoleosa]|uniref:Uncharacterized protein n=1 Tax=Camellia lanceoleosa TaxID=1840588 RepID=A0ACC0GIA5_9ERIC|nr:hypothetical protein LOK49_LG09G00922 [Camellia lanceoleosa]
MVGKEVNLIDNLEIASIFAFCSKSENESILRSGNNENKSRVFIDNMVQGFRKDMLAALSLFFKYSRREGMFINSCFAHCQSESQDTWLASDSPSVHNKVLHPCASSININSLIWNMYFRDLLPRLVKPGDDGNSGSTAVCDTICLQVVDKVQEETKSRAALFVSSISDVSINLNA